LFGESGTGKELFARACHALSPRRERPFVAINCAAIPRDLLENELFGSEKGAFTGAAARKLGKFELADKGTIFLDEIADLDPDLQAKLLRILQEMTFERLGGTATIRVDVRVIAATNQDLPALVKAKRFREDLYYRISVFPITIPPLRERPEDIPALVDYLLKKAGAARKVTAAAVAKLQRYPWPGNIRELENALERAVIMTGAMIDAADILLPRTEPEPVPEEAGRDLKSAGRLGRDAAEARLIKATLERTGGNKSEASRRLGVSYKTLLSRINRYRQKKLL
jgi:transcriptional regulator with PAS, ATPase and Fis domain